MSNPNPPAATVRAPRWVQWLAVLVLVGYAFFLARHSAIVAGGSDSSGYLNSARLLARGQFFTELRAPAEFGARGAVNPMHFLPQGFFPTADHARLTPTYPTGLPLHFALAGKFLGWETGPALLVLLAATGAIALCFLVAREVRVSVPLALAGAVVLAAFPVFIFTSVQPLSDTLATTWTLAALFAALRAQRSGTRRWALGCGAAFALAVLVRPTNVLLAPALLVLIGGSFRSLAWFALGGLPGAAWLGFYNHHLYGGALRSGYGDVAAAFALSYGAPTTLHFLKWFALLMPTVLLALPFAAWRRREARTRPLLALTLAFAAITGVYAFYEVSHEVWWCLRFILPAVPALLLAALLGVDALARGPARRREHAFRRIVAGGLALWAIGISHHWVPRLAVLMMKEYEQVYADATREAQLRLPRNALVACSAFSGSLYYYTEFLVLRTDQIEAPDFTRYATIARKAGRPVCAVLFDSEEAEAFRRCPGTWTRLTQFRNVGLWQYAGRPPDSRPNNP